MTEVICCTVSKNNQNRLTYPLLTSLFSPKINELSKPGCVGLYKFTMSSYVSKKVHVIDKIWTPGKKVHLID